jgi:hypothetical protein
MDSFFAKKGLTLSRGNVVAQKNGENLLRTQEQNARALAHPIGISNQHSLGKNT